MRSKLVVEKLQSFIGHKDCIYTIEHSKNASRFFFSAGGDGLVVKWDLENPESGEVIAKLPNSCYAIHLLSAPQLLIAGQNYEGLHLLDWEKKQEIKSLKLSKVLLFDIKSNGQNIFVASGDGAVTVIDLASWSVITKISESQKSARTIAINPISHELVIGYSDFYIRVFDLSTFQKKREWVAHQNSVFALAFSNDFKTLISASRDARIKTWSVNQQYALGQEVAAHLYAINSLAVSPDGKQFATGSMDKSVKIWATGHINLLKVVDKTRHAGHGTSVNKVLWTDNNHILSAGDDRAIHYWNVMEVG